MTSGPPQRSNGLLTWQHCHAVGGLEGWFGTVRGDLEGRRSAEGIKRTPLKENLEWPPAINRGHPTSAQKALFCLKHTHTHTHTHENNTNSLCKSTFPPRYCFKVCWQSALPLNTKLGCTGSHKTVSGHFASTSLSLNEWRKGGAGGVLRGRHIDTKMPGGRLGDDCRLETGL